MSENFEGYRSRGTAGCAGPARRRLHRGFERIDVRTDVFAVGTRSLIATCAAEAVVVARAVDEADVLQGWREVVVRRICARLPADDHVFDKDRAGGERRQR